MRVRKCISQTNSRCSAPFWAVWYHTLWVFHSSILFYLQPCLQIQVWRGQAVSFPSWERYGWGQMCWALCGSCRSNLVCTHRVTLLYVLCGLCIAASSGRTVRVCAVSGSFSDIEMIFIIFNSKFMAGPEKRKWKGSNISAAAKRLP